MRYRIMSLLVALVAAWAGAQQIPAVPLTPDLIAYLQQKQLASVQTNGDLVLGPSSPSGILAARCWSCRIGRKLIRGTTSIVSGAKDFTVDIATDVTTTVIDRTGDGIKWTAGQVADGTRVVVNQVGDVTTWTIDLAADGTKLIVRQTGNVVLYTIENAIPDQIGLGNTVFIDLDPVKNVAKAGVRMSVNLVNAGVDMNADLLKYLNSKMVDGAISTINVTEEGTYLMVDLMTFSTTNAIDITGEMAKGNMDEAVRRTIRTIDAALTNILSWGEVGHCGAATGLASVATGVLVPDYWPPDELAMATTIVGAVEFGSSMVCRPRGLARLYKGCRTHDACYGLIGKTRADCDEELRLDWLKACDDAYGSGYCRENCHVSTELYHSFVRMGGGEAYTNAQTASRNDPNVGNQQRIKYNESKAQFSSNVYPPMTTPKPASFVPQPFVMLIPSIASRSIRTILIY